MGYRKSVVSAMSPHCSEMQIAPRRCMMRLNCESLHLNVLKREIWNVGPIAGLPTRHANQVPPGECTRKGVSPSRVQNLRLIRHFLAEPVDDHRDGVFGRNTTLAAIKDLVFADFGG